MRIAVSMVMVAMGLAAMPPAFSQGRMFTYEPSQRLRTPADTCLKDEVMNGAYCVKKCQPDFRLEAQSKPPACVATKADAKYVPPKVWTPKEKTTPSAPVKGA